MTTTRSEPVWKLPLFRLLALNALAGATAGLVVSTGLIVLDVGGFGHLVAADATPLVPYALVTAGFVITLASVAMGVAVMRLGEGGEGGR